MKAQPSNYRNGELISLVAPVFDTPVEEIDDVIIIVKGICNKCRKRHRYQTASTSLDLGEIMQMMADIMGRIVTENLNNG